MRRIILTPEQRLQLEKIAEDETHRLRRRAQVLLKYDEGKPTRVVSYEIGLSPSQTRFWKRQFHLRGLDIFTTPQNRSKFAHQQNTTINFASTLEEHQIPSIPFPKPLKTPGVSPDDTLAEASRKILFFHFSHMLDHETGTRLGENIEELHDMRVAVRRMRSAFLVLGDVFQPKTTRKFNKSLRKIGRALGKVRDLDVLLEQLNVYRGTLSSDAKNGLDLLVQSWQTDLKQFRSELIELLDSAAYLNFKEDFNVFLQSPGMGVNLAHPTGIANQLVRHVLPSIVYGRMANVMAFDRRILFASIQELHALRIEFKQFRYTLEFFKEVLEPAVAEIIDEIKTLQDHLGELNDAHVACQILTTFLNEFEISELEKPLPMRTDPTAIVTYLANRYSVRHKKMLTFPERWEQFKRPEIRQKLAVALSSI